MTTSASTAAPTFVPADTRTMRIVHNAMRRDLTRAREVLDALPYPHNRQRIALAEHLTMIMAFLHKHHDAEESGLYPLVRRDPAAGALLAEMEADHDALDSGIAAVERAAAAYALDPGARADLATALDLLNPVLMPHLDREEDLLMPVVERTVTKAEWDAWERALARKRSLPELAREGLWVMDGATEDERALMTALVPAPVTWIILNVFGRAHRKRAFARWWTQEYSPWKLQVTASNSVIAAATPEQVWAVLADIARTGEWSHECHTVHWLDGSTGGVGARFRGANASGWAKWSRSCRVTAWEPGRLLTFHTLGPPDCSEWTFVLEPVENGTRITQSYRITRASALVGRLIWATMPAHHDRNEALRADLDRLAALVAS